MTGIIDYGMGNIHSVQKALESLGDKTIVTNNPEELRKCEKIVLPGVGAFADAMKELEKQGLVLAVIDAIKNKKIFLGICLGMQLLFESSRESKGAKGLGVLKGEVKKFIPGKGLKVPHMGWNQLNKVISDKAPGVTECPLLKGLPENSYVYFCHSYYPDPKYKEIVSATTDYGIKFTSVVWQDNIFGMQFHPEKSQAVGLRILKNFVELC
ncbi:MAG: imidazole glycerol phosphate synthase subunit HisH [Candidatus Omnitrophota bacterium]|nr:imidazole glycerol phosphate synthase subunit HisH [Candidatus Omnitrophota bacterium]MBU1929204.1 imidazole glycerol phosphate synthase subunit HisH [Candidatus Omnitrophota bacterium]MBU2035495.1 imidazole glycerol phosphate synthase subunit HisH [Candidatus Omnitrophota bacterium]MBU2221253.1 imidazole glycerol phosphate synthase subunit HisH [Candidatus Omnitrophota bacterium]MBU2258921.1 imidazole glycerol phosphate synthase subunit HisH [Candidatus Omnitrophota bacterium]